MKEAAVPVLSLPNSRYQSLSAMAESTHKFKSISSMQMWTGYLVPRESSKNF